MLVCDIDGYKYKVICAVASHNDVRDFGVLTWHDRQYFIIMNGVWQAKA